MPKPAPGPKVVHVSVTPRGFKQGRGGGPSTSHKLRIPQCRHDWSGWRLEGLWNDTERRDCSVCGRIQTRKVRRP